MVSNAGPMATSSVTSRTMALLPTPSAAISFSRASSLAARRPVMAIFAPAFARTIAKRLPRPLVAPVTSAVLPVKSKLIRSPSENILSLAMMQSLRRHATALSSPLHRLSLRHANRYCFRHGLSVVLYWKAPIGARDCRSPQFGV